MVSTARWDTAPRDPLEIAVESWIEAARRGDREALGQALLSFRDYLLLVANEEIEPALRAQEGASDLVQETFCRAKRHFEEFRGRSAGEWRSWLRSILVHHLANEHRRLRRTGPRPGPPGRAIDPVSRRSAAVWDETPSRELSRREREVALMQAIARLPDHYREVVIEHHRDRCTFEEVGQRRGISAEAARKLWVRALGRLRKELGPAHDWR